MFDKTNKLAIPARTLPY